jgi:rhodanese-related sulfurtransferase
MKTQSLIVCICLACILAFALAVVPEDAHKENVPVISTNRLKSMSGMPNIVIIDVRTARSWWRSGEKIATAVREDPDRVNQWASKYTPEQTLIFYCA